MPHGQQKQISRALVAEFLGTAWSTACCLRQWSSGPQPRPGQYRPICLMCGGHHRLRAHSLDFDLRRHIRPLQSDCQRSLGLSR